MAAVSSSELAALAAACNGGSSPNVCRQRGCARDAEVTTIQSKLPRAAPSLSRSSQPGPWLGGRGCIEETLVLYRVSTGAAAGSLRIPSASADIPGLPTKRSKSAASAAGSPREAGPWPRAPVAASTLPDVPCHSTMCRAALSASTKSATSALGRRWKSGAPWFRPRPGSSRDRRVEARPPAPRPISKRVTATGCLAACSNCHEQEVPATPAPTTATRIGAGRPGAPLADAGRAPEPSSWGGRALVPTVAPPQPSRVKPRGGGSSWAACSSGARGAWCMNP
mmetsp:Transcript_107875/g.343805  ORF Transcript_107875/g.343805 Transcript_107875/m.343805 type:complete len:281 (-) Transcript_107875:12-854(-)